MIIDACRHLRDAVAEFAAQGLERDAAVVFATPLNDLEETRSQLGGVSATSLDRHSDSLSAADTKGDNATTGVARFQSVEKSYQCAGAAGADRMSEGHSAAVDVQADVADTQFFHGCHRDNGERLVDFEHIDIAN